MTTESERAGALPRALVAVRMSSTVLGPGCQLTVPAGIAATRCGRYGCDAHQLNFRAPTVDAARVRILVGDEELFAGKIRPFKPSVMESFPLPTRRFSAHSIWALAR
ncbi:MAG: hypothetical protein ACLU0O_11610 [Collinsella sp.]